MKRGEEEGDDEGRGSIGEHSTGACEDDEPGIAAGVIKGSDAELIVKPVYRH